MFFPHYFCKIYRLIAAAEMAHSAEKNPFFSQAPSTG